MTRVFAVAAAALLAGAPAAYADDPQDGPPCAEQPGDDQQCQGPGNPADQVVDKAKQAADEAQKQLQQQQQQPPPDKRPISQVGYMYTTPFGAPVCLHNWDVAPPGARAIVPVQPC